MSEADRMGGDIPAYSTDNEHSQDSSGSKNATVVALQSELDFHRRHDKQQSYLSKALGILSSNERESLKELELLQADARKAVGSGDKDLLKEINKRADSAIKQDKQRLNFEDEVSHYAGGFLKTMTLFLKGRSALAGMMLTSALDQAKPTDSLSTQVQDLGLGAAKGLLTKATINALGQAKLGIAAQGVGMGVSARTTELGLDRSTYINQETGRFDLGLGLSKVTQKTFSPAALINDIAVFGAAHGMLAGGNQLTRDVIKRSPLLTTMLTGTTFGFASGTSGELARQNGAGEQLDLNKVLLRGVLQGAFDTVAAIPGGIQADLPLCTRIDQKAEQNLPRVVESGEGICRAVDKAIADLLNRFPPGSGRLPPLAVATAGSIENCAPNCKPPESTLHDFMMQATGVADTTLISDHREALSSRSLSAEEYLELAEENKRCRDQIIDFELELHAKQEIDTAELLEFKTAQLELLDDVANCQLEVLVEQRQEGLPLTFEQSRQERQLIQIARDGISYFSDLAQVRTLDSRESQIAARLTEEVDNYDRREWSISTALGHSSADLSLAERLRGARQRLTADWEDLSQGEPSEALLNRNAQDLELINSRSEEFRKISDRLSEPEEVELNALEELYCQGIEARFRRHLFWGPARMYDARGQLLPAFLQPQGGTTGRFAEKMLPEILKDVLDEQRIANPETSSFDDRSKFTKELNLLSRLLGGPRRDALLTRLGVERSDLNSKAASILFFEFLDARNWSGAPVPGGSAADHAKADYILFNKRTGHYFVLDFTTAVGDESQALLGSELVKTGKEVVLGGNKLKASADRTAFLIVVDPDLDYSSPQSIFRLRDGLAKILVHKIIGTEQPLNSCREPLPSSIPSRPATEKLAQLRAFENCLRKIGLTGWANEISNITYL
jgi:hypothetical protein